MHQKKSRTQNNTEEGVALQRMSTAQSMH